MRRLFFILGLLIATNVIVAQTNYYTESKVFQQNGYTYKVDHSTCVELYNAENKWIDKEPTYKDTGEFFDSENSRFELTFNSSWDKAISLCDSIIRAEFSAGDMERICNDEHDIVVSLYINSETGIVEEVSFSFYHKSAYAYIPVSTYRRLELAIKEYVRLSLANDYKILTFVYCWLNFDLKKSNNI